MTNWKEWYNKTRKYAVYQKQCSEVLDDILDLGSTFLDVGCGDGRFVRALESHGKKVDGLDIQYNGFNILTDPWPNKMYDVVFANLVLDVLDESQVQYVCDQMIAHSKYVYFFDEFRDDLTCGQEVDIGKWNHNPEHHINKPLVFSTTSVVQPIWKRFLFRVDQDETQTTRS